MRRLSLNDPDGKNDIAGRPSFRRCSTCLAHGPKTSRKPKKILLVKCLVAKAEICQGFSQELDLGASLTLPQAGQSQACVAPALRRWNGASAVPPCRKSARRSSATHQLRYTGLHRHAQRTHGPRRHNFRRGQFFHQYSALQYQLPSPALAGNQLSLFRHRPLQSSLPGIAPTAASPSKPGCRAKYTG